MGLFGRGCWEGFQERWLQRLWLPLLTGAGFIDYHVLSLFTIIYHSFISIHSFIIIFYFLGFQNQVFMFYVVGFGGAV